jgi:multicomponent Na+:H+ antiporter subunit G
MNWLASALMLIGSVFLLMSSIGLIRLPDFYTRAQAVGKAETLGSMLVLLGLAVHNGAELTTIKILLVLAIIFITNPTATHALTRAAFRSGVAIWKKADEQNRNDLAN